MGFCGWAGKRLCGDLGGGPRPPGDLFGKDAARSEWFAACSANGTRTYPYGVSYDANACIGEGAPAPAAPGSKATCEGSVAGLLDMSGNLDEWEDSCRAASDGGVECAARGGRWGGNIASLRCDEFQMRGYLAARGFRCCATPR
jgi:hypothetical protein